MALRLRIPHMVCQLLMMQSTSNRMMSLNMKLFEVRDQCIHVCIVCVCVCVCGGHNYYDYPSDTHVDAVLYETIDPITKTAAKV